jgi:probable F420-dependent oxidoreductase
MDHVMECQLSPIAAMSFAAEATERLRVGVLVLDNDFRHPALLAKEMATVDLLSDGRLELGIGAGWWPDEYRALGLTFDSPGVRIARLEESLSILKQFFDGGPVNFSGTHYQVEGLEARPPVVQRPRPPLIVGGSQRRMLSLAARQADIVSVNSTMGGHPVGSVVGRSTTAAATDLKISWLREAAGERFHSLEIQCPVHVVGVGRSAAAAAADFAQRYGLEAGEVNDASIGLFGSVDEIVERLQERRDRFGFSYISIPDRFLDEFAPVVARLVGSPDR